MSECERGCVCERAHVCDRMCERLCVRVCERVFMYERAVCVSECVGDREREGGGRERKKMSLRVRNGQVDLNLSSKDRKL